MDEESGFDQKLKELEDLKNKRYQISIDKINKNEITKIKKEPSTPNFFIKKDTEKFYESLKNEIEIMKAIKNENIV